ncbi:Uncharacterized conserved protein, contains GRAM domain [Plasmopara halstedii]|uniref:Uncharacterized conserved protein, contains GRAM domain n=1 Tax=Plasmopara halstedii TaxID=4781 RepID=A0A0P1AFU0_PLAHL|nr:Uncharacterized conserved protein, contains GRAM domain [Plasmopara halstedii]CEG39897.1 Uncharacterized conserved protein, contains GRAM domain [Plasmopara halstedii]|eukprot:XP_024576266.1 Uncharacterized conserved protein, contains GRAM domain [Plasmopara halstedii]
MKQKQKRFIVQIVLHKCQDLAAADLDILGGKSDPYVNFTLGGVTKKSSCIKKNLNPEWMPPERFDFKLDEWENKFVIADVFDHDRFGKDDLIGSAVIPLSLFAGNRHSEVYSYPLVVPEKMSGPRSDLFLQISLSTIDGNSTDYYY